LIAPTEAYSAAAFCRDALRVMQEIVARGHTPLLVGGTMLYAKALQEGLSDLPEADANVREALEARAAVEGWPRLHAELAQVDATTAARLKPNDAQRIQRALEVWQLTGTPISQLQQRAAAQYVLPFEIHALGLIPAERAVLHQRIAQRFDAMLAGGLLDELRGLKQRYHLHADMPSMRAVGYRQAWEYLDGRIDERTLRDTGLAATRQLAKRQLTWLRSMPNLTIADSLARHANQHVVASIERFLESGPL
jgi:tRNA dimethylallyltransferase